LRRLLAALAATAALVAVLATQAAAQVPAPAKRAVATGRGGAASSVDPLATQAAIRVLRGGGNAVDAAVAAAAVLGVVEPYSCGIGGGGFMLVYRARTHRVVALDSRETAPRAFGPTSFVDPATGRPYPFAEQVESGIGVGVPGTLRTWQTALRRFGSLPLARLLRPGIRVAEQGFVVDQTFFDQTQSNRDRFDDFTTTRDVFLTPGTHQPPPVGSVFRNPDLARTYREIASRPGGVEAFYRGDIGQAIVDTVRNPPVVPGTTRNVRPGVMGVSDLRRYRAIDRPPASSRYRGLRQYGMGPPSSGGSTVGEALNILEGYPLSQMTRAQALHYYLEASAFSFADRGRYLGDPAFVDVPLAGLLSDSFAAERRALIGPTAATKPVPPGDPTDNEGPSTTHLTVADKWGNVVAYTFTIEQTGGSGIVAGDAGFLLNNELTDFEFMPGLPNSPAANKRPRSSMSPTIVLRKGRPELTVGSPGGSTIITTVLQILVEHLDLGKSLPDAIASPRASQRNNPSVFAEPAFVASPDAMALQALGHAFADVPEIGAATGIDFRAHGVMQAAAEPVRRGGGHAMAIGPRGRAPACSFFEVSKRPPRRAGRVGRRLHLSVFAHLSGMPADARVTVRGAGVRALARATRGHAEVSIRPRSVGRLVIRVGACVRRIPVLPSRASAVGATLTGRLR
jgi:gamma-glutamyltranspeptidase/glutathione hydrolase